MKVDLSVRKYRAKKKRNLLLLLISALFGAFTVYFFSFTAFVMFRHFRVNRAFQTVETEMENVSREMTINSDRLNQFVLSKYILAEIGSRVSQKFAYKEYLDQIVSSLPSGVVVRNVDFSNRNWVVVSVTVPGSKTLRRLEKSLVESGDRSDSYFSSAFVESILMDSNGSISVKLQFEIKKNVKH